MKKKIINRQKGSIEYQEEDSLAQMSDEIENFGNRELKEKIERMKNQIQQYKHGDDETD